MPYTSFAIGDWHKTTRIMSSNFCQIYKKSSCLDSLVVVPLGGEHDGAAVDLEAADPGEGAALVDELPVLVALAPLQDAVEGVWTNQTSVLWPTLH